MTHIMTLNKETTFEKFPGLLSEIPNYTRTSKAYVPIATSSVMMPFFDAGFETQSVRYSKMREGIRTGKGPVMVTMINKDAPIISKDGTYETAIIMNSLSGDKSLQVAHGALRGACFNTCFFGDVQGDMRVIHRGDNARDISSLIDVFMSERATKQDLVLELVDKEATLENAISLIAAARELRPILRQVSPVSLIEPKRMADTGGDLWTLYNRVQETVIRGGYHQLYSGKIVKIRALTGIDAIKKANDALWRVAA